MSEEAVKVFFVQKNKDGELETESLWCVRDNDNYVIDNIPFIAKRISLGDTIKVEHDEDDNALYFDDFVKVSGNSTVRIYFEKNADIISKCRKELEEFGCESEAFLKRKIISVNIPKEIDYKPIKKYLDKGEQDKLWVYEESCLAHKIETE